MKTELANYLNAEADKTKAAQRGRTTRKPERQDQSNRHRCEAAHSPLPWGIRAEDEITADDKTQVCTFFPCPQSEANAAYIVKACNEYPKLLALLRQYHEAMPTTETLELFGNG